MLAESFFYPLCFSCMTLLGHRMFDVQFTYMAGNGEKSHPAMIFRSEVCAEPWSEIKNYKRVHNGVLPSVMINGVPWKTVDHVFQDNTCAVEWKSGS